MTSVYLKALSRRQRIWLVASLVAGLGIVVAGALLQSPQKQDEAKVCSVSMSIRQIARPLGVTGKSLARELGLPLDVSKHTPLRELGVSQKKLSAAVRHVKGHRATTFKYYVYVALCLWGFVFLVVLGRPDGASIKQRRIWYPRWPYLLILVIAVVVAGFALGKSPNPMEGAVKLFKAMVGLYPSGWARVGCFLFFAALAVIGNKLICGVACPFGALQELVFSIPGLGKQRRWKPPFWVTNTIRGGLFVLAMLLLFGVIGGKVGYVIYHFVNPFSLFSFDIDYVLTWVVIIGSVVVGFFFYRPFCQLICPFGFLSWILERISLYRVSVDHEKCIECGNCDQVCPLSAADDRVKQKSFPADCFSCSRCLKACPADAIRYRRRS
jgi:NAD-dependent dihydropyrimidine dehydrogenase PreA subunit